MRALLGLWRHFKGHKKIYTILVITTLVLVYIFRPQPNFDLPTQQVRKGNISVTVLSTGAVEASRTVNLTFQIPGLVTYVNAQEGEYVEEYQTIAAIDQRTVQKKLKDALLDYSKQRNLFEQEKDNQGAKTPRDAINDKIKRILENNQFDLDKAVISVELEDLVRQQSFLTTPISGILSRADIEIPGVVASSGTTYTVVDPNSIVFSMDVDEVDVGKLLVGQLVTITLDAYPDEEIVKELSKIDFVAKNTDTGGIAFSAKASLPIDESTKYRVGMRGDGEILINQKKNVLIIPLISVVDEDKVYIRTDEGYIKRKIKLGIQNESDVEVISGLTIDDYVVLQPDQVDNGNDDVKLF